MGDPGCQPPEELVVKTQEADHPSGQADGEADGVDPGTGIIGELTDQVARYQVDQDGCGDGNDPAFRGEVADLGSHVDVPVGGQEDWHVQGNDVGQLFTDTEVVLGV